MSGYFPQRTFNGVPGEASVDLGGPDELEKNLDDINAMFNPDATHTDGSPGGLTKDNLAEGEFDASNIDVDPITGVSGSDLQTVLESEKTLIDQNASAIADRYTKAEVNAIVNSLPRISSSSNYNIIDNSWFLVNTRRQLSGDFSNGVYRMDRWLTTYSAQPASASWTWAENGLLTITTGANPMYFAQVLNNVDYLNDKMITASILLSNGVIYSGSVTRANGTRQTIAASGVGISIAMFEDDRLMLAIQANKTFTIRAVKLELGSQSTLANDMPPIYEEELIRCITSTVVPTDRLSGKLIGANCNPNLLDNPWFGAGQRINQRYISTLPTGTEAKYFLDRWKCVRVTGSITNDGISVAWDGVNGTNGNIQQILTGDYRDTTLTVSVNINGTIYTGSFYHTTTESYAFTVDGKDFTLQVDNANVDGIHTRLLLIMTNTTAVTIRSIKVEVGAVSTLKNEAPPNYAIELAKCQRFFFKINPQSNLTVLGFGNAGEGVAIILIPTPVTMRTTPTVTVTNIGNLQINVAGTMVTPTAVTIRNAQSNGIMIGVSCSVSGSDIALLRALATGGGAALEFSADL